MTREGERIPSRLRIASQTEEARFSTAFTGADAQLLMPSTRPWTSCAPTCFMRSTSPRSQARASLSPLRMASQATPPSLRGADRRPCRAFQPWRAKPRAAWKSPWKRALRALMPDTTTVLRAVKTAWATRTRPCQPWERASPSRARAGKRALAASHRARRAPRAASTRTPPTRMGTERTALSPSQTLRAPCRARSRSRVRRPTTTSTKPRTTRTTPASPSPKMGARRRRSPRRKPKRKPRPNPRAYMTRSQAGRTPAREAWRLSPTGRKRPARASPRPRSSARTGAKAPRRAFRVSTTPCRKAALACQAWRNRAAVPARAVRRRPRGFRRTARPKRSSARRARVAPWARAPKAPRRRPAAPRRAISPRRRARPRERPRSWRVRLPAAPCRARRPSLAWAEAKPMAARLPTTNPPRTRRPPRTPSTPTTAPRRRGKRSRRSETRLMRPVSRSATGVTIGSSAFPRTIHTRSSAFLRSWSWFLRVRLRFWNSWRTLPVYRAGSATRPRAVRKVPRDPTSLAMSSAYSMPKRSVRRVSWSGAARRRLRKSRMAPAASRLRASWSPCAVRPRRARASWKALDWAGAVARRWKRAFKPVAATWGAVPRARRLAPKAATCSPVSPRSFPVPPTRRMTFRISGAVAAMLLER